MHVVKNSLKMTTVFRGLNAKRTFAIKDDTLCVYHLRLLNQI